MCRPRTRGAKGTKKAKEENRKDVDTQGNEDGEDGRGLRGEAHGMKLDLTRTVKLERWKDW